MTETKFSVCKYSVLETLRFHTLKPGCAYASFRITGEQIISFRTANCRPSDLLQSFATPSPAEQAAERIY